MLWQNLPELLAHQYSYKNSASRKVLPLKKKIQCHGLDNIIFMNLQILIISSTLLFYKSEYVLTYMEHLCLVVPFIGQYLKVRITSYSFRQF